MPEELQLAPSVAAQPVRVRPEGRLSRMMTFVAVCVGSEVSFTNWFVNVTFEFTTTACGAAAFAEAAFAVAAFSLRDACPGLPVLSEQFPKLCAAVVVILRFTRLCGAEKSRYRGKGATVIVKLWVALWGKNTLLLLTYTVKLNVPGMVGVPLTAPVVGFRVKPLGNAPAVTDHV